MISALSLGTIAANVTINTAELVAGVARAAAEYKALGTEIAGELHKLDQAQKESALVAKAAAKEKSDAEKASAKTIIATTREVEAEQKRAAQAMEKASRDAAKAAREHAAEVKKAYAGLNTLSNGALLVGGAMAAGMYEAEKAAASFQKQMELSHTQAGATQEQVDRLSQSVLKLAPAVGQGPEELSKALYHIISTGVPAAQQMDVLTEAAKGAKIGNADLEETTNALAGAMINNMKDVHGAADAMAELNAIVGSGNMRMDELNEGMGTGILPTAKAVGLGLRDVGAALATMKDLQIPVSVGATNLARTFLSIANPTDKAAKALASVGIGSKQLANDLRQPDGLLMALEDIKQHMDASGKSAVDQERVLADAFGGVKSGKTMILLAENIDRVNSKYVQGDGLVKQYGADWVSTTQLASFKTDQLKATYESLTIQLGTQLLPTFVKLTGGVTDLLKEFNGLTDGEKNALVQVALGVTAFLLIGGAIGKAVVITRMLIGAVTACGTALGIFGAEEATVATEAWAAAGGLIALEGPLGIIAGILAAPIVAGTIGAALVGGGLAYGIAKENEAAANSQISENEKAGAAGAWMNKMAETRKEIAAAKAQHNPGLVADLTDKLEKQDLAFNQQGWTHGGTEAQHLKLKIRALDDQIAEDGPDEAKHLRAEQKDLKARLAKLEPPLPAAAGAPSFPSDFSGARTAGGSAGEAILRHLHDAIETPAGQASCAYFASGVMRAAGLAIPSTGGAHALVEEAKKRGAIQVALSDLQPGDLLQWHGSRYGAHGSGYHVGLYEGDGMYRQSSDGRVRTERLHDTAHLTAYRLPDTLHSQTRERQAKELETQQKDDLREQTKAEAAAEKARKERTDRYNATVDARLETESNLAYGNPALVHKANLDKIRAEEAKDLAASREDDYTGASPDAIKAKAHSAELAEDWRYLGEKKEYLKKLAETAKEQKAAHQEQTRAGEDAVLAAEDSRADTPLREHLARVHHLEVQSKRDVQDAMAKFGSPSMAVLDTVRQGAAAMDKENRDYAKAMAEEAKRAGDSRKEANRAAQDAILAAEDSRADTPLRQHLFNLHNLTVQNSRNAADAMEKYGSPSMAVVDVIKAGDADVAKEDARYAKELKDKATKADERTAELKEQLYELTHDEYNAASQRIAEQLRKDLAAGDDPALALRIATAAQMKLDLDQATAKAEKQKAHDDRMQSLNDRMFDLANGEYAQQRRKAYEEYQAELASGDDPATALALRTATLTDIDKRSTADSVAKLDEKDSQNQSLEDKIYDLQHNQFDNQRRGIQETANADVKAGNDPELVAQWLMAAMADVDQKQKAAQPGSDTAQLVAKALAGGIEKKIKGSDGKIVGESLEAIILRATGKKGEISPESRSLMAAGREHVTAAHRLSDSARSLKEAAGAIHGRSGGGSEPGTGPAGTGVKLDDSLTRVLGGTGASIGGMGLLEPAISDILTGSSDTTNFLGDLLGGKGSMSQYLAGPATDGGAGSGGGGGAGDAGGSGGKSSGGLGWGSLAGGALTSLLGKGNDNLGFLDPIAQLAESGTFGPIGSAIGFASEFLGGIFGGSKKPPKPTVVSQAGTTVHIAIGTVNHNGPGDVSKLAESIGWHVQQQMATRGAY